MLNPQCLLCLVADCRSRHLFENCCSGQLFANCLRGSFFKFCKVFQISFWVSHFLQFIFTNANYCCRQHFCNLLLQKTSPHIVVLNNILANWLRIICFHKICNFLFWTTFCEVSSNITCLQIAVPDNILANWSSGQHICKLILLSIILQINVLVNNSANCQ